MRKGSVQKLRGPPRSFGKSRCQNLCHVTPTVYSRSVPSFHQLDGVVGATSFAQLRWRNLVGANLRTRESIAVRMLDLRSSSRGFPVRSAHTRAECGVWDAELKTLDRARRLRRSALMPGHHGSSIHASLSSSRCRSSRHVVSDQVTPAKLALERSAPSGLRSGRTRATHHRFPSDVSRLLGPFFEGRTRPRVTPLTHNDDECNSISPAPATEIRRPSRLLWRTCPNFFSWRLTTIDASSPLPNSGAGDTSNSV